MATDRERKEAYWRATAKSYANKEGDIIIPAEELGGIVEITLGFQPLGISSSEGGRIAIADYHGPAICLARVTRNSTGLSFEEIQWINGVDYEGRSVRLFPDILQPSDINRAQTVNFGPEGTLWVTRNADAEFFVLGPPQAAGERWRLINRVTVPTEGVIHSALLQGDVLYTVEADHDAENWCIRRYDWNGIEITDGTFLVPIRDFVYGIDVYDNHLWSVPDLRADLTPGLYKSSEIFVPGIQGNGVAFLKDGGALVTRYGQSSSNPFRDPGALLYIPPEVSNLGSDI